MISKVDYNTIDYDINKMNEYYYYINLLKDESIYSDELLKEYEEYQMKQMSELGINNKTIYGISATNDKVVMIKGMGE